MAAEGTLETGSPTRDRWFWLVLGGAFLFHLAVIRRTPNLAWPDEVFQTLEQGHRLAFGYGMIPWEYRDGVRSWFLPGLLGAVMRATAFLGSGPRGYLLGVDVFLALASLSPVATTMAWARRAGLRPVWLAGAACAVWFELVYFSGKALTEVFAAYALAPALLLSDLSRRSGERRHALWAGALWGLAVGLRFHLAPAALVGFVWIARRDLKRWAQLLAGGGAVILVFGLVDWVSWSYPFQSFFLNFWTNMVKGKAQFFGESPALEYVASLA